VALDLAVSRFSGARIFDMYGIVYEGHQFKTVMMPEDWVGWLYVSVSPDFYELQEAY